MVRQCVVCKKKDILNPELTFHRIPLDHRRQIWLSLLSFENDEQISKSALVCSQHFEDILMRSNESKYLKPGATPKPWHSIFSKTSSQSSDSATSSATLDSPPKILEMQHVLVSSPEKNVPSTSARSTLDQFEVRSEALSSDTLTASEVDEEKEIYIKHAGPKISTMQSRFKLSVKRKYVGDMSSSDFSTPRKRRKNLKIIRTTVTTQRKKIHMLQQTVRRLKLRITNLNSLLGYLKKKTMISETSESAIKASLSGPAMDIFERLLKGPTRQKYNPSLRSFALTLSFYSAKAYNFVRNTFNKSLPHLGTISKWYRAVDGSPGFTNKALVALTLRQQQSSKPLLCSLMLDEMSIRRQIEWTGEKFTGYVDIGTDLDTDSLPEAREVLVFLLVCINGSWKVPVGYFLLDGLTAIEKAQLVKKCLEFVNESGVLVTSLTFDGAPVNITMAQHLGANFSNITDLKTSFKHPINQTDVYIYLDPCHMIKLVRNCLASQDGIKDSENRDVRWSFISQLVDTQIAEGLHAATKVRMRHLQWSNEKMKVRLATQTLSKSVSDAITFLREDLNFSHFKDSEGTSNFILNFNDLFDIFNSRNRLAKYFYKKPLSPVSADFVFRRLQLLKDYILGLTLRGRLITYSARKIGFLGFLICIESLKKMYNSYVVEKHLLKYLPTYKFSQDHLELFFGAIRSKGGYNNNPTARQFEAAYKRLLVHSEISAPETGNSLNLEQITILTASSNSTNRLCLTESGLDAEESDEYRSFIQHIITDMEESNYMSSPAWNLTPYIEDIVCCIAGFVVRIIKKFIICSTCLYYIETESCSSLLQDRKTYGKLTKASSIVINTCRAGENFFRVFHKTNNIFNKRGTNLYNILIAGTFKDLPSSIFDAFGDHFFDDEPLNNHVTELIKLILKKYFKLRIHHETASHLDLTRKRRLRSIHTKTILFRNE